jgi:lipoprotein-anchoring transpeptidase ErfK/SrfK
VPLRVRFRPTISVPAVTAMWRSPIAWLAACAVALGLAPAVAAAQAPASAVVAPAAQSPLAGLKNPGDTVILSDERTTTRWAHVQETAKVRSEPRRAARAVARLHFLTEDGEAEVYIVLDGRLDSARRRWLHIRIPTRGNRRTGWVLAEALSRLYVVRTQLVIDRSALDAKLYRSGQLVWSAPVGIGKSDTPTPRGTFWIRELLKGLGDGDTYGPWAFGTSAYSNISDWPGGGVVGIHGTNKPGLVPGRPSHGCVRVRNDKVRQLVKLMPIGTPVRIVR